MTSVDRDVEIDNTEISFTKVLDVKIKLKRNGKPTAWHGKLDVYENACDTTASIDHSASN